MHAFLLDGRRRHTDALAAALTISTFISSVSAKFPPRSARSLRGRSSSADRALGTLAHALAPVAVSEKPHLLLLLKERKKHARLMSLLSTEQVLSRTRLVLL